jgi:hypothetical protein
MGRKYDGKKHVVTDPLNLTIGDKLKANCFRRSNERCYRRNWNQKKNP